MNAIWQEYDCPRCGIDFDLNGAEIVSEGEYFHCSGCGGTHVGGKDGPTQTCVSIGGTLDFRGVPPDAETKAAWLAEVAR